MADNRGSARKTGFLTKQGKNRKSWKLRFFVLEGGSITYFKGKGQEVDATPSGKPLGSFSVDGKKFGIAEVYEGRIDLFWVDSGGRRYWISTGMRPELKLWVECLVANGALPADVGDLRRKLGLELEDPGEQIRVGPDERVSAYAFVHPTFEGSLGKAGDLRKRGTSRSFKQRYFVLSRRVLYYFKGADDDNCLGRIALEGREVREGPFEAFSHTFFVRFPKGSGRDERVYWFKAETDAQMTQWMDVLLVAANGDQGQSESDRAATDGSLAAVTATASTSNPATPTGAASTSTAHEGEAMATAAEANPPQDATSGPGLDDVDESLVVMWANGILQTRQIHLNAIPHTKRGLVLALVTEKVLDLLPFFGSTQDISALSPAEDAAVAELACEATRRAGIWDAAWSAAAVLDPNSSAVFYRLMSALIAHSEATEEAKSAPGSKRASQTSPASAHGSGFNSVASGDDGNDQERRTQRMESVSVVVSAATGIVVDDEPERPPPPKLLNVGGEIVSRSSAAAGRSDSDAGSDTGSAVEVEIQMFNLGSAKRTTLADLAGESGFDTALADVGGGGSGGGKGPLFSSTSSSGSGAREEPAGASSSSSSEVDDSDFDPFNERGRGGDARVVSVAGGSLAGVEGQQPVRPPPPGVASNRNPATAVAAAIPSGIAANPALAGLQGHGRPYRASGSVLPARPSPPRGSLALPSEAGSGAEERSSEEMAKLLRLQKIIVPWMNKVLEADGIVVDDLNEEDFADGVMLLMVIARTIRPPGLAYHAVPLNGAQIEENHQTGRKALAKAGITEADWSIDDFRNNNILGIVICLGHIAVRYR